MTTPPLEMIWPHYPAPEGHSCDAMGCASAGPHNIEPELKAMTTPTPRTDALHTIACIASALITGPSEYSRAELKGFANELSSAHLQLERDLAAALEENERLRAALKEANDTCRSAYQVASRGGKDTDMEAWKFAIQKSLKAQHMVMHPEQYAEDRLIHTKGEPR